MLKRYILQCIQSIALLGPLVAVAQTSALPTMTTQTAVAASAPVTKAALGKGVQASTSKNTQAKLLRLAKPTGDIYLYQTKAGDTAQSIAFDFIEQAHQKQQFNRFVTLNKIQGAQFKKPRALPINKAVRIPFSMMFLKIEQAQVLSTSGVFTVLNPDQSVAVSTAAANTVNTATEGQKPAMLTEGSTVRTGDLSLVTVRFPDLSTLTLEPNSELYIQKMRRFGNSDAFSIEVLLSYGRAQTQVTPLKYSVSQYGIRTQRILTGVRGTAFSVSDRASENALVEVQEGAVALVDENNVTHLIQAGFGRYSNSKLVSAPIPLISLASITCTNKLAPALDLFEFATDSTDVDQVLLKIYQLTDGGQPFNRRLVSSSMHQTKEIKFPSHLPDGEFILNLQGQDRNGLQGFNTSRAFTVTSENVARRPASLPRSAAQTNDTSAPQTLIDSHTVKKYQCKA